MNDPITSTLTATISSTISPTPIITIIYQPIKSIIESIPWDKIITLLLAIYGTILSTYTFYIQRKDKRPRVKVSLFQGFITGQSDTFLFLNAANSGEKNVTLSSHALIVPGKKQLIFPNAKATVSFPCELLPGKSCKVWIPIKLVEDSLREHGYKSKVKIKALFHDETDNHYVSLPYAVDLNEHKA